MIMTNYNYDELSQLYIWKYRCMLNLSEAEQAGEAIRVL